MDPWYKATLLNIPIAIWILQLLYVGLLWLVLSLIYNKTHKKSDLVVCIIIAIIINIIWRLAIRKMF